MEGPNQGGGEVRKLHIIYFLSRKGRIEHPHLIRVHHFSRNGIRLRDVKRWLEELRGKEMPESFAWSYKRKYQTGYVWQDLLDEDLITPISDNEYVLKGSEIPFHTTIKGVSCGEKGVTTATTMQKEQTKQEDQNQESLMDSSKKTPSEIEEESQNIASETSTLTTDSPKLIQEEEKVGNNSSSSSFSSNSSYSFSSFGSMKTKKKSEDDVKEKNSTSQNSEKKSSKNPKLNKSRSYSNGASNIFRNLITCGAVDTNDSGIVPLRKNKTCSSDVPVDRTVSFSSEICKADKIGGSQRIFGTTLYQQQTNARKSCDGAFSFSKNKSEFGSRRSVSANYKPINGPNCS
ncbi:unnamed protein product [Withania somnifera]